MFIEISFEKATLKLWYTLTILFVGCFVNTAHLIQNMKSFTFASWIYTDKHPYLHFLKVQRPKKTKNKKKTQNNCLMK